MFSTDLNTNNCQKTSVIKALQDLDARVESNGLTIWIGGEPTFTDRFSEAPEWVSSALGGNKEARAIELVRKFAAAFPGGAVLRTIGRQYPGEIGPRWNFGLLALRNGEILWRGPLDPLLLKHAASVPPDLRLFRECLAQALKAEGWNLVVLDSHVSPEIRLLGCSDGRSIVLEHLDAEQLQRPSIHAGLIPEGGLHDELAEDGIAIVLLEILTYEATSCLSVELPSLANINSYLTLLSAIEQAALDLKLEALVLRGYPPPIDRRLHWTTVTPDPAVIEINLTPSANLTELFQINDELFNAAADCNLAPYRLHYNGRETDSGGGGQLTIGGPIPDASPFFLEPQLLPRLIRYFNHYPALSYWFGPESLGSGSQSPRPDEGPRERWLELEIALEQLEQRTFPDPAVLWASLAPLLVDSTGNSHRCEINIEKLWNPYIGDRGLLGLVEIRAFRMAPDAATLAAEAALLRAIVARLMRYPFTNSLINWGDRLHDYFALPYNLALNLQTVFDDLNNHGLGLGEPLVRLLLDNTRRKIGQVEWQGVKIQVSSALEFWPLIGDAIAQHGRDSRLIDASTSRIELSLEALTNHQLDDWRLQVNGVSVPMHIASANPRVLLTGIRYRSFVPWVGLHPNMPALDKVVMVLHSQHLETALCLTLFGWTPQGGAYPGLPQHIEEARDRRRERLVITELPIAALGQPQSLPASAMSEACVDLRRINLHVPK